MTRNPRPPRLAGWLAARIVPRVADEAALGDLDERYRHRVVRDGRAAAARWYVRQIAGFILRVPISRRRARARTFAGAGISTAGWSSDLRNAARVIVQQRGFSSATVVVLGLAVGAVTAVFSVINGVLIRPLPFAAPDALVMIWDEYPPDDPTRDPKPVTLLHYRAWRERPEFASVGAFESTTAVLHAGRWPEQLDAALVSASVFETLGVRPALGRLFTHLDDVPGADPVVIIGHELWQSRFGGDPQILGRTIPVDGVETRVVGVMPADFWFYDPYAVNRSYTGASAAAARLWRPFAGRFDDELDYPRYRVFARLRSGVSIDVSAAAAGAAETALTPQLKAADGRVRVVPLLDQITAPVRSRLLALAAAVALVLLVAAINLVSLFVARFDARRTEFAVRTALGATRGRLARALLVHGALLGLAGGTAGVLAAAVAVPMLRDLVPRGLPLAHRVGIDVQVVGFALAVSVAVGVAVAAAASWRLGETGLAVAAASRSRSVAGSAGRQRLTKITIATEVCLTLVLFIAATLLLRSLAATYATDPGFESRSVLTFRSILMLSSRGAPPDYSFFDRLETRLAAIPAVDRVGSAALLPFSRWAQGAIVRAGVDVKEPVRVDYRAVSPGYFDALRISRRIGRGFTVDDRPGAPSVAIVNQAFVDRYFAGADATTRSITVVSRGREVVCDIVGVVGNVLETRLFSDARPILYVPIAQSPMPMRQFAVRASGNQVALADAIRQAAAEVDRRQPLQEFITLDALVDQSMEEERFFGAVTTGFAAVAILLAVAGLYGVVSMAVRERDREVGVRLALGSTPARVSRLIVLDGMRPVVAGLVAGCVAAAAVSHLLRSLLHGIPPSDPVSYAVATAMLAAIAMIACGIPARRAAAIDPVQVLSR